MAATIWGQGTGLIRGHGTNVGHVDLAAPISHGGAAVASAVAAGSHSAAHGTAVAAPTAGSGSPDEPWFCLSVLWFLVLGDTASKGR